MKNKWKEKDNVPIKKRFDDRIKLMKPLIKLFNDPVLAHATLNEKTFKR